MKLKKLLNVCCAVIVLFAVIGCDKAMALSLNVEKGDKYNTHMLTDQETILTINNKAMKTNQIMDMNLAMDVKNVDEDKNVTICYKYDSVKISQESLGKKMIYDSNQPDENNPLSPIYGSMVGKDFTVKMDNKGRVLDIRGLDTILNSMVDNIPGTQEQKKALKASLAQSFGDDAIKSMIEQSMNYYPPQNVKIGDVWETKYDLKIMFPMTIANKWKLLSEKDGLLNVDVQSSIEANTKNGAMDFMGVKAKVKMNGDCTGTLAINKDTGLIQNGEFAQNINGEIELLSNESVPKTLKVPMQMKSKITYETTKQSS